MTFSDIKNKIYFLTKTDSVQFPIADLVISANNAVEHVVALINQADMRWQWDDLNNTDLPIATTTITSGQQDYSLATSHLTIDRIEVKDSSGNWRVLKQIDQQDLKRGSATPLSSYAGSGVPTEYDVLGSSILLYPTPNYTLAAALKIYFTRGPVAFTSSDTTATPGFASLFHELVPLWVAYDYAVAINQPTARGFLSAIQLKEAQITDFYGNRNRDRRQGFTIATNGITGAQSGRLGGGASDSNR